MLMKQEEAKIDEIRAAEDEKKKVRAIHPSHDNQKYF